MFCCSNCFADAEIKAIIDGKKQPVIAIFAGKTAFMYMKLEQTKQSRNSLMV